MDDCFVDALSGLMSVVAKDICLKVEKNQDIQLPFKKEMFRISKTFGEMWNKIKDVDNEQIFEINLSMLLQGISKDFIFEIEIDKVGEGFHINDFQRNSVFLNISLSGEDLEGKKFSKKS